MRMTWKEYGRFDLTRENLRAVTTETLPEYCQWVAWASTGAKGLTATELQTYLSQLMQGLLPTTKPAWPYSVRDWPMCAELEKRGLWRSDPIWGE